MESTLRRAQIIWAALLVAAFIYVLAPELVHVAVKEVNMTVVVVCAFLAAFLVFSIVRFRRKLVDRPEEALRINPGDQPALKKWMVGQVLTFALSEAIVLYGLVIRFMGGGRREAIPFYIVGIGAMIVFRPKRIE